MAARKRAPKKGPAGGAAGAAAARAEPAPKDTQGEPRAQQGPPEGTPEEQAENRAGRDTSTGRFLPGVSGNPGGRPKGRLGMTGLLREVLEYQVGANGPTVAEAAMRKLGEQILRDPAAHFGILRWYEERTLGATPQLHLVGHGMLPNGEPDGEVVDADVPTRGQLDAYLAELEPAERAAVVGMLARLEEAVPGLIRCR